MVVFGDSLSDHMGVLLSVFGLAGFCSGLAGFAFSAVAAAAIWILPPMQAIPTLMVLSLANQMLSLGTLWQDMRLFGAPDGLDGAFLYIIGGLTGVPIGLMVLSILPAQAFSIALGAFLIVYSLYMIVHMAYGPFWTFTHRGWPASLAVGALGGIVGGFSAFPGSMLVVYLGLRGASKSQTRMVVQPYIFVLQIFSLVLLCLTSSVLYDGSFWLLTLLCLPIVLAGTLSGVRVYRQMTEVNFRYAVLILVLVSGIALIAKAFL